MVYVLTRSYMPYSLGIWLTYVFNLRREYSLPTYAAWCSEFSRNYAIRTPLLRKTKVCLAVERAHRSFDVWMALPDETVDDTIHRSVSTFRKYK